VTKEALPSIRKEVVFRREVFRRGGKSRKRKDLRARASRAGGHVGGAWSLEKARREEGRNKRWLIRYERRGAETSSEKGLRETF